MQFVFGNAMRNLRVVVVDDSPVFLKAAVGVLMDLPGFDIVGMAASALEALELAADEDPDLVLTDLAMPDMDGLELTRRLVEASNRTRVVIMTAHAQSHYRVAASEAGVDGFVHKAELSAQLPTILQGLKDSGRLRVELDAPAE